MELVNYTSVPASLYPINLDNLSAEVTFTILDPDKYGLPLNGINLQLSLYPYKDNEMVSNQHTDIYYSLDYEGRFTEDDSSSSYILFVSENISCTYFFTVGEKMTETISFGLLSNITVNGLNIDFDCILTNDTEFLRTSGANVDLDFNQLFISYFITSNVDRSNIEVECSISIPTGKLSTKADYSILIHY